MSSRVVIEFDKYLGMLPVALGLFPSFPKNGKAVTHEVCQVPTQQHERLLKGTPEILVLILLCRHLFAQGKSYLDSGDECLRTVRMRFLRASQPSTGVLYVFD